MPWVRIDDHIDQHPKIAALDDHAFALFVCGLAYCNRTLTDGFIPNDVALGQLRFCEGNTVPAIRQLEEVGLWEEVDGGWRVHDYHHFQPKRSTVLRERRETAKRVTAYRRRNADSNDSGNAVTTPPSRTRSRTLGTKGQKQEQEQEKKQEQPLTTSAVNGQKRPLPAVVFRSPEGFVVPDDLITRWEASYPAIDVRHELSAAFEWSVANPKNAKSNWPRFLVNWFKRAQDKAPPKGDPPVQERELSPELKRIWGES